MKRVAISLLMAFLILAIPVFAQVKNASVESLMSEGDDLYKKKGGKRLALDKYRAVIDLDPENIKANYMAGLCYLQTSQKSRSLNYFLKAHDIEPDFVADFKIGSDLFPDLRFLIARAFHVGENYTKAEEYYNHFKESLTMGTACRYTLSNKNNALRAAERRIFECLVADEMKKIPLDSRIVNLKEVNSPYPDYGPVFTQDGKTMYFTSRRAGGASSELEEDLHFFEDIYKATKDSTGKWGNVQLVKELSTPGHESVLCISPDGKYMVISRGEGNGDLYMCEKALFGKWSEPTPMGKNINTNSRETGAFLVAGGKKIFFASDRSGGFGGLDLYYSEKRSNGSWGAAVNLGPKVNTSFDEDAPSVEKDGLGLVFSSKGHKSMGGFDVFKAKWDPTVQEFKNPQNLGFPINSADDDNTYISAPDTGIAYYASFKEIGEGDLDIYHLMNGPPLPEEEKKDREEFKELAKENVPLLETQVNDLTKDSSSIQAKEADRLADLARAAKTEETKLPAPNDSTQKNENSVEVSILDLSPTPAIGPPVENGSGYFMYDPNRDLIENESRKETYVRILVMDTDTRIPLDGQVVFIDEETKERFVPTRVRNGVYEIASREKTARQYLIAVEKDGFHFKNIRINVPPASATRSIYVTRNIELKRHTLNKPRILRNVYFDFNQADLSDRSFHELDMLRKMLEENDKLIIEVSGHADFVGTDEYNNDLSKKRAESVVAYLAEKGIDKSRLRAMGYGERKPVPGSDTSETGRALNRRTEFMIMAQ
jgi:outer membrane protein OmpA-like peptidoglycan-associated protein